MRSWATSRWMLIVLGVSVATVLASCASTKYSAPPAASPDVLRGSSLEVVACPTSTPAGPAITMQTAEVKEIVLCPVREGIAPPTPGAPTTVAASNAAFAGLLAALAGPDLTAERQAVYCPAYADNPQIVEAKSLVAVMAVHIPTDGCGHYQSAFLYARMRAMFGFTVVGLGDNGRTFSLHQGQILDIALPAPPVTKGWQPPQTSVPTVLSVLTYHAPVVGGSTATLRASQPGRTQVVVSYRCPHGACAGWGIWIDVTG